jgi:hypothetical protein
MPLYTKGYWTLAQQLANHLRASCYALSELKGENLYHTVKEEMAKPAKK